MNGKNRFSNNIRIIIVILFGLLAFACCGQKNTVSTEDGITDNSVTGSSTVSSDDSDVLLRSEFTETPKENYETVFAKQKLPELPFVGSVWNVYCSDKKVYYVSYEWKSDEGGNRYMDRSAYHMYVSDTDGGNFSKIDPGLAGTECSFDFSSLFDGENLWLSVSEKKEDSNKYNNYFLKMEDGTVSEKKVVPEEILTNSTGRAIDKNGTLYAIENKNIIVVPEDGIFRTISLGDGEGMKLAVNRESRVFAIYSVKGRCVISEVDTEEYRLLEPVSTERENIFPECLNGDENYDLYLSFDKTIYGYDFDNRSCEKICDFTSSYFHANVVGVPDINTLVGQEMQNLEYIPKIYKRVDAETIKNQKTLKLAVFSPVSGAELSYIEDFTAENPGIRIEVADYSEYGEKALEQLGLDIAQGKGPDVYGNYVFGMTRTQCVQKGMFASLDEYFEKDALISASDIIPSVLEAMKTDGKIYCTARNFRLDAIMVKRGMAGKGWNIKEFSEFVDEKGEDRYYLGTTGEERLGALLNGYFASHADVDKGRIDFMNDDFRYILEFSKESKNLEDMVYSPGESFKKNESILICHTVEYDDSTKVQYGEDYTFIGYPTDDRNGIYIIPENCYSMASGCKNKDEAWKFISYGMHEDFQNVETYSDNAYSIWQKVFDEKLQKKVTSGTISESEAIELKEFVNRAEKAQDIPEEIIYTIYEEAEAYFQGERSLKEVQEIIQDKCSVILSENR